VWEGGAMIGVAVIFVTGLITSGVAQSDIPPWIRAWAPAVSALVAYLVGAGVFR